MIWVNIDMGGGTKRNLHHSYTQVFISFLTQKGDFGPLWSDFFSSGGKIYCIIWNIESGVIYTHISEKIVVMILCHFSIYIKLWICCALYLHDWQKEGLDFPRSGWRRRPLGTDFGPVRGNFAIWNLIFGPLISLGTFKSIVWSLGLDFGPLRSNIEPLEAYFWP